MIQICITGTFAMSKFPSQEMDRFNVRLPNGMRDAIAERAKANGRSMNSEIIQILEDALDGNSSAETTEALLEAVIALGKLINVRDLTKDELLQVIANKKPT